MKLLTDRLDFPIQAEEYWRLLIGNVRSLTEQLDSLPFVEKKRLNFYRNLIKRMTIARFRNRSFH